MFILSDMINKI